jgi:hypothetical protein
MIGNLLIVHSIISFIRWKHSIIMSMILFEHSIVEFKRSTQLRAHCKLLIELLIRQFQLLNCQVEH